MSKYRKKTKPRMKKSNIAIILDILLIIIGIIIIIDGGGSYILQFNEIDQLHFYYQLGRLFRVGLGSIILIIGIIALRKNIK